MADEREAIIALSRKRLAGQGWDLYQDQSFKLPKPSLKKGRREEFADAVNYYVIELAKEGGVE
jgi:hypothetical protein